MTLFTDRPIASGISRYPGSTLSQRGRGDQVLQHTCNLFMEPHKEDANYSMAEFTLRPTLLDFIDYNSEENFGDHSNIHYL